MHAALRLVGRVKDGENEVFGWADADYSIERRTTEKAESTIVSQMLLEGLLPTVAK